MTTYTEKEIKEWFEITLSEYKNTPMGDHVRAVQSLMFDPFWEKENLKNVKTPLTESK